MTYQEWIDDFVRRFTGRTVGLCSSATQKMQSAFPELRRARGHVMTLAGYWRTHWWCVAEDGRIVDPTKCQFAELGGVVEYLEHEGPEPLGRCMGCGEYCYDDPTFCSEACERDVRLSMGI